MKNKLFMIAAILAAIAMIAVCIIKFLNQPKWYAVFD